MFSNQILPAQILLMEHQLRAADERLRQLHTERATLEQQTGFADDRIAQLEEELASLSSSVIEQQAQRTAAADASEQARLHEEETSASSCRRCGSRLQRKNSARKTCSISGSQWPLARPNWRN